MSASILDPRMIDQLKPLTVTNTNFANITSTLISTPGGTSNDWTATYEIVESLSGDWNSTFNTVQGLSSTWEETLLIADLSATSFDLLTSVEDLFEQTVFLGIPTYIYAETEDDVVRGYYKRQNYTLPLSDSSFYYEKFTGVSASNIFAYYDSLSSLWVISNQSAASAVGQSIYATNSTAPINNVPLYYWDPVEDIRIQLSDSGDSVYQSLSGTSNIRFTNFTTTATTLTATTQVIEVMVNGVPKYLPLFDIN